jgi:hypothetical protein
MSEPVTAGVTVHLVCDGSAGDCDGFKPGVVGIEYWGGRGRREAMSSAGLGVGTDEPGRVNLERGRSTTCMTEPARHLTQIDTTSQ